MKRFYRAVASAENAAAIAACAIFIFVALSICAEVLMRYGFNRPIPWVVEISEYALLWITMLGSAWVLREGGHVRVDILLYFLSGNSLRWCGLLSAASGAVAALVLFVFGARATFTAFIRGSYKTTGIDVPTWMVTIVIPVGGALLLLRFLILFHEYWTRRRDFGAEPSH